MIWNDVLVYIHVLWDSVADACQVAPRRQARIIKLYVCPRSVLKWHIWNDGNWLRVLVCLLSFLGLNRIINFPPFLLYFSILEMHCASTFHFRRRVTAKQLNELLHKRKRSITWRKTGLPIKISIAPGFSMPLKRITH